MKRFLPLCLACALGLFIGCSTPPTREALLPTMPPVTSSEQSPEAPIAGQDGPQSDTAEGSRGTVPAAADGEVLFAVEVTPTPTPIPTPAPTPTPTPEPRTTPRPTIVPEELLLEGIADEYFADTVFIGDSLTANLRNYSVGERRKNPNFFSNAEFCGGVSFSMRLAAKNLRNGKLFLTVDGRQYSVAEGLGKKGTKRVFILLGVNDGVAKGAASYLEHTNTFLDLINTYAPDCEIVLQGVFPVTKRHCKDKNFTIKAHNAINEQLELLCEVRGIRFLNFSDKLKDANGYLDSKYTSDGLFHMSRAGNDLWVMELRRYAAMELGLQPPDAVDPSELTPEEVQYYADLAAGLITMPEEPQNTETESDEVPESEDALPSEDTADAATSAEGDASDDDAPEDDPAVPEDGADITEG